MIRRPVAMMLLAPRRRDAGHSRTLPMWPPTPRGRHRRAPPATPALRSVLLAGQERCSMGISFDAAGISAAMWTSAPVEPC